MGNELVDVESLGAYAKEQWDLGDQHAAEAGEPYWVRGAEALEKAKASVLALGKETFGAYQERVTGRDESTCRERRQAYRKYIEDKSTRKSSNGAAGSRASIRGLSGKAKRDNASRQAREQLHTRIENRSKEDAAVRALAKRMIDIGYKTLAKELHPDAGGSKEAMVRLGDAKKRCYRVFGL